MAGDSTRESLLRSTAQVAYELRSVVPSGGTPRPLSQRACWQDVSESERRGLCTGPEQPTGGLP